LTELQPTELSLDLIRADALIFLESDEFILHVEFQTSPNENIPFRLTDYRLRGYRRDPTKPMQSVGIYLKQTASPLVYQTSFTMERTCHEFDVIRLWEKPASIFLQYPGLIPFAASGHPVFRFVSHRLDRQRSLVSSSPSCCQSRKISAARGEQKTSLNVFWF
jgi:predicted transposase YdaD